MMFDVMGALSTKYNDTPELPPRTYDADRDGFVILVAAMLAIEEFEYLSCSWRENLRRDRRLRRNFRWLRYLLLLLVKAFVVAKMAMQNVDGVDYATMVSTCPVGDVAEARCHPRSICGNSPATFQQLKRWQVMLWKASTRKRFYSTPSDNGFIAPSINVFLT